jgi:hypothetical protein
MFLESVCETIGGKDLGKPCIFTADVTECEFDSSVWSLYCFTKRDSEGKGVESKWGTCGPGCPFKLTDAERKIILVENKRIRSNNGNKSVIRSHYLHYVTMVDNNRDRSHIPVRPVYTILEYLFLFAPACNHMLLLSCRLHNCRPHRLASVIAMRKSVRNLLHSGHAPYA